MLIGADGEAIPTPAGTRRALPSTNTERCVVMRWVVTSLDVHWMPSTGVPVAAVAKDASVDGVGVGAGVFEACVLG